MSSSQAVQASVTEVKRDQEYANFINKNRYFVDGINTYTLIKKYGWKKVNDPPKLQNGRVFFSKSVQCSVRVRPYGQLTVRFPYNEFVLTRGFKNVVKLSKLYSQLLPLCKFDTPSGFKSCVECCIQS